MLKWIKQQGCNLSDSLVMTTTTDFHAWMEEDIQIIDLIKKITKYATAFQCNPVKVESAVDHAVTFCFEWVFTSMFIFGPPTFPFFVLCLLIDIPRVTLFLFFLQFQQFVLEIGPMSDNHLPHCCGIRRRLHSCHSPCRVPRRQTVVIIVHLAQRF
jgi:hypothetical protein